MNRTQLFQDALARCENLIGKYPGDPSLLSIVIQLNYLIELDAGARNDFDRLKDIIIGVLAVREIEPLDASLAEILYKVDEEAEDMKSSIQ
jgi:hypothetical protein